jgi:zinc/manganese transport system ATP-binding protein
VTALAFSGVTLALGRRAVLTNVSFSVAVGEFIGVLGPNGAGKTTLMRAILGLVRARSGRIDVLGHAARRGNAAVGYMPQSRRAAAGLRLSGRDFVAGVWHGNRWGLPMMDGAGRRETDWALDLVGARDLARRRLTDMSGGERQRLLLAQALIGRPRLLLLDEPLMNLDPSHQAAIVALVKALQTELGMAVLFSAHELNPLLGALDRVLYLGGGRAACGPVAEVITGPVLSRLYGAEIEVMRVDGRIFVMAGGNDVQRDEHRHDDHGHDA